MSAAPAPAPESSPELPRSDRPPFRNAAEYDAIPAPEHCRAIEELLKRTLEKTELQTDAAKALDRLNPKQRDYNLLVIETLTNLFEGYRAVRAQVDVLSRTLADLTRTMPELKDAIERTIKENTERERAKQ